MSLPIGQSFRFYLSQRVGFARIAMETPTRFHRPLPPVRPPPFLGFPEPERLEPAA